jgi:hypothetical protein
MGTHPPRRFPPRAAALLLGTRLLLLGLGAGCASSPELDPRYRPAENVLEVLAVLRRHVPDDTYRFEPARDFTGRNVYRASLIRLENLERVHGPALGGGMDGVIAMGKGRALERIRAFDLAARSYRRAAELEPELHQEALRSAALCDALDEAARLGSDAEVPGSDLAVPPGDEAGVLAAFEKRVALLEALLADQGDTHYAVLIHEELERADVARARFFAASRHLAPDGNVRALGELQRVVVRHRESKNANRHVLALADLYAQIAREYVETHPPEGLIFDPPTFEELVDSASELYQAVANQDGTAERLEASRQLEAFLAFTLRVDRDRFSQ